MTEEERTVRVGPKGQVVIPKAVRDKLGIRPGDHVRVGRSGDEVRVRSRLSSGELRGIFAGTKGGTDAVEDEHRRELEREERAARRRSRA